MCVYLHPKVLEAQLRWIRSRQCHCVALPSPHTHCPHNHTLPGGTPPQNTPKCMKTEVLTNLPYVNPPPPPAPPPPTAWYGWRGPAEQGQEVLRGLYRERGRHWRQAIRLVMDLGMDLPITETEWSQPHLNASQRVPPRPASTLSHPPSHALVGMGWRASSSCSGVHHRGRRFHSFRWQSTQAACHTSAPNPHSFPPNFRGWGVAECACQRRQWSVVVQPFPTHSLPIGTGGPVPSAVPLGRPPCWWWLGGGGGIVMGEVCRLGLTLGCAVGRACARGGPCRVREGVWVT